MKDTSYLKDLYRMKHEKTSELKYYEEQGKLSEGMNNKFNKEIDELGKKIDEEIEVQELSSEESSKAQEECEQENEHSR